MENLRRVEKHCQFVVIRLAVVGRFKTVTLPLIEPVIVEYPLPMERTTLIFWPLKFKRLIGRCTDQPANEKVLWRALLKSNAEEVAEKQDLLASFGLFWRFFSPASTASSRSSPDTGGLRLGSAMVIVHAACSIRRFFNNIPGLFVKFPTSTVRLIVAFGPRLRPALRFGCSYAAIRYPNRT